jgi:hypothetical protein
LALFQLTRNVGDSANPFPRLFYFFATICQAQLTALNWLVDCGFLCRDKQHSIDLPNPISPAVAFLDGRNSLPSDGAFFETAFPLCGKRALKNSKKFIGKDTPKELHFLLSTVSSF